MTTRKSFTAIAAAALLAVTPLATIATPIPAGAQVAQAAATELRIDGSPFVMTTAGAWVPIRVKIKNTTSKAIGKVVLRVTPKAGVQVSSKSVAVGRIAPGAAKVAALRIRLTAPQSSATLKAVSPRATSNVSTVTLMGGFGN